MFNLGMGEISVILLLALIFIGPKKLPELASGLGKLIREIRKTTSDVKNEIQLDESIRKPFEELREAVTLHPDELKRRDRLRKELAEIQKRAEESIASVGGEGEPGADGQTDGTTGDPANGDVPTGDTVPGDTTSSDAPLSVGPSPVPGEGSDAASGGVTSHEGALGTRPAAAAAPDLAASTVTPPPVLVTPPTVPGAAPSGTVAREPSGSFASPAHIAPPAPPLAAVLAKGAVPERKAAVPPSGSDFLRSLRAVPESRKPLPGRPAPAQPLGAADRANTTQTLTEADLAAITVVSPPPPPTPGQTGRAATPPPPPTRLPGATPPKTRTS